MSKLSVSRKLEIASNFLRWRATSGRMAAWEKVRKIASWLAKYEKGLQVIVDTLDWVCSAPNDMLPYTEFPRELLELALSNYEVNPDAVYQAALRETFKASPRCEQARLVEFWKAHYPALRVMQKEEIAYDLLFSDTSSKNKVICKIVLEFEGEKVDVQRPSTALLVLKHLHETKLKDHERVIRTLLDSPVRLISNGVKRVVFSSRTGREMLTPPRDEIISMLESKDPRERKLALVHISRILLLEDFEIVKSACGDSNCRVRRYAAHLLGRLSRRFRSRDAYVEIIRMLSSSKYAEKRVGLEAALVAGLSVEQIAPHVDDRDPGIRRHAAAVSAQLGASQDFLVSRLQHENEALVLEVLVKGLFKAASIPTVVEAVSRITGKVATERLLRAVQTVYWISRSEIVDNREVISTLLDSSEETERICALRSCCHMLHGDVNLRSKVLRALGDESAAIQQAAFKCLVAGYGTYREVESLLRSDEWARRLLVNSFQHNLIAKYAELVVEELKEVLTSPRASDARKQADFLIGTKGLLEWFLEELE